MGHLAFLNSFFSQVETCIFKQICLSGAHPVLREASENLLAASPRCLRL